MRNVIRKDLHRRTLRALEEECCGALFIRSTTEDEYECSVCEATITVADVYREAMNREEGFQTMDREERRRIYNEKRAAKLVLEAEAAEEQAKARAKMREWRERHDIRGGLGPVQDAETE